MNYGFQPRLVALATLNYARDRLPPYLPRGSTLQVVAKVPRLAKPNYDGLQQTHILESQSLFS